MTTFLTLLRKLAMICHLRERPDPQVVEKRIRESERLDRLRDPEKYRGRDLMN